MKSWIDRAYIYQILVDRFTGDKSLKNENKFLGGTINGIIEHLDYIHSMGFNTLWLSPICQSKNYHGYHITDFYRVDPHFGSLEDVKRLIDLVHKQGMHIITDFVPNHCADTHPFFIEAQKETSSPYRKWFYFNEDESYRCFMGFKELPKIDLDYEPARHYMINVAKYWCKLGFDGLRIDHAIGPSFHFWKIFQKEMSQQYPSKVFFGEVWSAGLDTEFFNTVHLKHKWEKRHYGISQEILQQDYIGVLNGVLDFEYREILLRHIMMGERIVNNKQLQWEVRRHFMKYPKDFKLILFLDNHDTDRILFSCHGDASLVKEAIKFSRQQSHPFVVYYGTEVGMTNKETIFSGKPYADLAVRECLF